LKRGEEIQEVKTQCAGAQEEGDDEGEAGQEGKGQKTRAEAIPAPVAPSQSAPAPPLGGKEMAL
jgi:hypothetical protein